MVFFVNVRNHQNNSDNNIRRRRIFRDRLHLVHAYSYIDFTRWHWLPRNFTFDLYDEIVINIEPTTKRNDAIPVVIQLSCALMFYASCNFRAVV